MANPVPIKKQTIIVADIFNGIPQEWKNLLLAPEIKQEFLNVLGCLSTQDGTITPSISMMFNFARLTPLNDIKVIIIGQDPYPTEGHAQGISFSSASSKIPMSLHKIYGALIKSGFIDKKPDSADLSHWAKQGVLLINTAFTTLVGKANAHQDIWAAYTTGLLNLIGSYKGYNIHKRVTCLWGNFAKSYTSNFSPELGWINLTYTHPVARDPNDFTKCDHFTKIKELGINIQWATENSIPKKLEQFNDEDYKYLIEGDSRYPRHWFSDGAGKNNQSKDCKAYWGFLSTKPDQSIKKCGPIPPIGEVRPTNIRAEGMALLEILRTIKSENLDGPHLLHTDSEFWINTMDHWIPKRFKDPKYKLSNNPNSDIAEPFWILLNELRKTKKVDFQFVRAFHDYVKDTRIDPVNGYSPYFWEGNKAAEAMAESAIPK